MLRIRFAAVAVAALFLHAGPTEAEDAVLPVEIAAFSPKIHYVGRFDSSDAKGPRCAWSACSASLRFKGTAVNVKLNESGGAAIGLEGVNRYEIVVDGKPVRMLTPKRGEGVYTLASKLAPGEHTVEVFRRTEASLGVTQFLGFQLDADGEALDPVKPRRRIEVIGDSISCGYGNEAKAKEEPFKIETENAYLTYGAIAARAVKAAYVGIAWSGKKMWPDSTIAEIYDRTLPSDASSTWDFSKAIPDAVLINLGTNDFSNGNPDKKAWTTAYTKFVRHVRKNYPRAMIYCASGPMVKDSWPPEQKALTTLNQYLNSIVDALKESGDTNVRVIAFGAQDETDGVGKNGIGSGWHPSVKTHELMTAMWVKALKKDLGW
jgi:lysophospholipase L1-like esterase